MTTDDFGNELASPGRYRPIAATWHLDRSEINVTAFPELDQVGDIVMRVHAAEAPAEDRLEILSADPLVLITVNLCEQMLFSPNRWGRIEIKERHPTNCPTPMPAGHCSHPVKTATFSDDFGHEYVYEIGQHHDINGLEVFEAKWPD